MTKKLLLAAVLSWPLFSGCGGSSSQTSDAAPSCDEGAMRAGTCGNCGMVSERCEGGVWVPQGDCLGEGECAAGTTETSALPLCGEQERLCDNACHWGAWNETVPGTGDCEPGDERMSQEDCASGFFRRQTCSESCAWVTQSDACADACGGAPRTTAEEDEQEICIPEGPFIRGLIGVADSEPVQTVMMSAYYIDKYAVTNRRYKACVDAGGCTLPSVNTTGTARVTDPAYAAHPVWGVSWDQAQTFCAWDGGRRLVTEAEWEKAVRGPAPRENKFPWDGDTWRCDLLPTSGCPGYTSPGFTDPYYATPGDVGWAYPVTGMLCSGYQWVSDYYNAFYYADPSSLVDPQGPGIGSHHVIRGFFHGSCSATGATTIATREDSGTSVGSVGAIRCGHSAGSM